MGGGVNKGGGGSFVITHRLAIVANGVNSVCLYAAVCREEQCRVSEALDEPYTYQQSTKPLEMLDQILVLYMLP